MAASRSGGSAAGGALLGGVMMILLGVFHAIEGLIGILNSSFYGTVPKHLLALTASTWSWTHLIVGIVVALVGLAVLSGAAWGRIVGIAIVFISAVGNFLFVPYYPVWSIFLLAVDIFVIWSLATWEPEEIS